MKLVRDLMDVYDWTIVVFHPDSIDGSVQCVGPTDGSKLNAAAYQRHVSIAGQQSQCGCHWFHQVGFAPFMTSIGKPQQLKMRSSSYRQIQVTIAFLVMAPVFNMQLDFEITLIGVSG